MGSAPRSARPRGDDRILPMDTAAARRWGVLPSDIGNNNADLLIAATALTHGLTVVTRHERLADISEG